MKTKFLALIFAVFFAFALSIAGASAESLDVSASNINTAHNTDVSSSFVVMNKNVTANMTNISCSISIPSLNVSLTPACPSIIEKNSSSSVSFSFKVPQYTLSNTYSGTINVAGVILGITESKSTSFNINVQKTLDLSLSFVNQLSEVYQNQKQNITIRVTNTGNTLLTSANFSVLSDMESENIEFTKFIGSLPPSNFTDISVNMTFADEDVGSNYIILKATGYNETSSLEKSIQNTFDIFYPLCENRDSGYISLVQIVNDDELEDEEFKPLDTINIELEVRNNDNERKYAKVNAVLVYKNDKVDDTDVEEKIRVDESDEIQHSLAIKIPADVEEGTYYLYASAYDADEEDNCNQKVVKIDIVRESYEVSPLSIEVEPKEVNCTGEFTLSGKLVNIGAHDEDKVKIVYKDDFGNTDSKLFSSLKEGKETSLFSFAFSVPEDAGEKEHSIALDVYYDYNEADDEYDEVKSYEYSINVQGNCIAKESEKIFSLTPQITGFMGKNLYASVLVENSGADSEFKVEASADWASVVSVEPSEFSLKKDESKNVIINLVPNKGISEGLYNLDVKITSGEKTETKTIPVYVYASSGKNWLDSIKDSLKFSTNQTWLWTAIVAGLVLVFIVFIVYFLVRPGMPNFLKMIQVQK